MKDLHQLKDKLCEELSMQGKEVMKKSRLSGGDVEYLRMLTDTIKNIKIQMLEEGGYSEDGYSRGGNWSANMEGEYGHGSSYARHRDSMGRYSRDGYSQRGYSRDGYSGNGYSRDGGNMVGMLEDMIAKASDKDREAMLRFMKDLRGE